MIFPAFEVHVCRRKLGKIKSSLQHQLEPRRKIWFQWKVIVIQKADRKICDEI